MNFYKLLYLFGFCWFIAGAVHAHFISANDFQVSGKYKIKVYGNFPLNGSNHDIERAVIVVHGVARNADEYFDYTQTAAQMEKVENRTLVLAPHFKIESDPRDPGELYWTDSWKFGDLSAKETVSSYEVLDRIIKEIGSSGHFPSLKKITLIGHSAGGQTIARYAAGNAIEKYSVEVSYVISNPSSYLYFAPERFDDVKGFIIPDSSCPDYHSYPYGTNQTNSYMSQATPDELQLRFNQREVTLLLGEADTLSDYLDTSCEANLQGKNRIERGMNYYRFIKSFYPNSHLKLITVPKIGHSGKEMIQSKAARELLFH